MEEGFSKIDLSIAAGAFVSTLSTRRLELRSVLSSYAIAVNFPPHTFNAHVGNFKNCGTCGSYISETETNIDLNVLSFERHKWGGVRLTHPEYVALDLQQFANSISASATPEDYNILEQILDRADKLSSNSTPNDLEKALAGVFKSNKAERRVIIEILGICGVLQPTSNTGFFREFTATLNRSFPSHAKNDWSYPVCWWSGADGVNWDAVSYWFPELS